MAIQFKRAVASLGEFFQYLLHDILPSRLYSYAAIGNIHRPLKVKEG